jgi:hypothetical protein
MACLRQTMPPAFKVTDCDLEALSVFSSFKVTICDLESLASDKDSRNMKSSGKRSRFRLTA